MKKHLHIIILILVAFVGLSLLLYPTVSNYINSLHQSEVVAHYKEATDELDNSEIEKIKSDAEKYNLKLLNSKQRFISGDSVGETYKSLLNFSDNGMMGYISIDKLGVQFPIYHGTSETILSNGIGHLEGSSLPVGGENTHCVLTGHRGVASSELFTNLDKIDAGDEFTLTVLDNVLTYKVDKISIVEPTDDSMLFVEDGEDYVTLMTCTPYAVNTHRLLVRGVRTETDTQSSYNITPDAVLVDSNLVAIFVSLPMIIIFVTWIFLKGIVEKRVYKFFILRKMLKNNS